MKVFLDGCVPRIIPGASFQCVPHEGKQDLEKSVPRKLRAWREPGVRFVVVRDNDGADCRALKARLVKDCAAAGRSDTLVRIVCQELEAWYLGAPRSVAAAFDAPELLGLAAKARFREPDAVSQPGKALQHLVPQFQKVGAARAMAKCIDIEANTSRSFQAFATGIRRLWAAD